VALLNIFDSRGLGLTLLKALIEQEVENTESESELIRIRQMERFRLSKEGAAGDNQTIDHVVCSLRS
jgi:hypothetical protein